MQLLVITGPLQVYTCIHRYFFHREFRCFVAEVYRLTCMGECSYINLVQVYKCHPFSIRRNGELAAILTFKYRAVVTAIQLAAIEGFIQRAKKIATCLVIDSCSVFIKFRVLALISNKFFLAAIYRHNINTGFYCKGIAHNIVTTLFCKYEPLPIR